MRNAEYFRNLAKLMRNIQDTNLSEAEQYTLLFRYLAYDYTQPFLPQYKDNMLFFEGTPQSVAARIKNGGRIYVL